MGMFKMSGVSVEPPNPNPRNFKILRWEGVTPGGTIVEVFYPGVSTFEGRKLMVFQRPAAEIVCATEIDPHFTGANGLVARLQPTPEGWHLAHMILHALSTGGFPGISGSAAAASFPHPTTR